VVAVAGRSATWVVVRDDVVGADRQHGGAAAGPHLQGLPYIRSMEARSVGYRLASIFAGAPLTPTIAGKLFGSADESNTVPWRST
jgi:hypothetical protein